MQVLEDLGPVGEPPVFAGHEAEHGSRATALSRRERRRRLQHDRREQERGADEQTGATTTASAGLHTPTLVQGRRG